MTSRACLVLLFSVMVTATASAQPRIDTAARNALRWDYTEVADGLSTIAVVGALTAPCLIDRHWSCVKQEGVRVGTALLAAMITKYVFPRTRPDGSDNKSFFSQHTALTCAAVTGTKVWALCPSVGYLRVAADKHWATDAMAGGVVGSLMWTIQF